MTSCCIVPPGLSIKILHQQCDKKNKNINIYKNKYIYIYIYIYIYMSLQYMQYVPAIETMYFLYS